LQEFYVKATSKLGRPLTPERAEARVRDLTRLPLVQVDPSLILAAIARSRSLGFSFWDALTVEAALRAGAGRLLTEDLLPVLEIGGLRIENPFL
jgi:predicted nucleic acid-binding protein